jgi:quercetin dioxygenase-like cupin family protein
MIALFLLITRPARLKCLEGFAFIIKVLSLARNSISRYLSFHSVLKKGGPTMSKSKKIESPAIIKACGDIPKIIEEFIGAVNTGNKNVSIARMISPKGWNEPGQTPKFDEYTLVLKGYLNVETRKKNFKVKEGQAFIAAAKEWVRYSSPEGSEYIAVCIPAFSPDSVRRDE